MVLIWIGIGIGVLITTILIIKAIKTSSQEVLEIEAHCRKCGLKINGQKCPRCEKGPQFGV
ncbi:MAG: hypothetical protein OEM18_01495 [Nitrosopumilus sp.]|jgi:predicted Zn-ribbon and HTH transcriptional regulator|nr:hypothetical protein [Nitrosopumilus sp.]MDH3501771.1 hypothetical protein [Nitrosopumilus sp.]